MAITTKEEGVWGLDEVYNKINQGGIWSYDAPMNGQLWIWGDNELGAMGQNTDVGGWADAGPLQIPGTTWSDCIGSSGGGSGYKQNGALKSDGSLWTWGGYNNGGELGHNDRNMRSSPTQVPGTWKLRQDTDAGTQTEKYNFLANGVCYAIKTDNTLWAWGYNGYGALGLNQSPGNPGSQRSSPTQVGTETTWKYINKSGDGGTQMTKTDGTLWTMGRNTYGRLGQNNQTDYSSPVQISGTTWNGVAGGSKHWFVTKTDGSLWGFSDNSQGQLAQNSTSVAAYSSPVRVGTDTNWSTVDTSGDCVVAVKTDGTLWSWGRNEVGALGQNQGPGSGTVSSPTQIGTGTTWLNVVSVRENGYQAVKSDGTLWAWGENSEGELGQGNQTNRSSPTQIPGTDWSVKLGGYQKGALAIKTP